MTGRARDRINRLARAVDRFRRDGSSLRERLCAETPHMAGETMAAGLDMALEPWDETGIAALWSEEQPYLAGGHGPALAAVVLGGVLPPSHIQAIAYPWLLGAEVIVKHPSADPLFPRLFAEALGEGITVVGRLGLGGVLSRADAVVAVGDDDSVRAIGGEVAVGTPFVGYGNRTAVTIVLGPVARAEPVAQDVLRDVVTFDQLGCLSPREIFVVGGAADARVLGENLARGMADLPMRAPLGPAVEGALRAHREGALVRGDVVHGPDDLQWGVQVQEGGVWTGTPGGRHVIVRLVDRLPDIPDTLAAARGRLSAVAVAGGDLDPVLQGTLIRQGASRIVRAGQLQAAPPTWPHDGHRPLASLCRWCAAD